jgi:hypothetical protein
MENPYKLDNYQSHDMLINISEWLTDVIRWLNMPGKIERDWKLLEHYKYK